MDLFNKTYAIQVDEVRTSLQKTRNSRNTSIMDVSKGNLMFKTENKFDDETVRE